MPPHIQQLLQAIYPTIRWEKVRMYEGLPWFVAAWTSALVLPNIWRHQTVHIYFRKIDTQSLRGLAILIHECFHVLQYQDTQKRYQFGMFRFFLVHYVAFYLEGFFRYIQKFPFAQATQKAYYFHQMEIPAYQQDSLFTKAGSAFIYHHKSFDLLQNEAIFKDFIEKNRELIKISSNVFSAKPLFFYKLISLFLCSILLVFNPILELLLKIIFYIYFIFSKKKHRFAA